VKWTLGAQARAVSIGEVPAARAAYDGLTHSRKREQVRAIDSAKKPETCQRRIGKAMATLRALSR
jgi:uncharacterized protein YdeI (YjbR/CyaY-like superfamily)